MCTLKHTFTQTRRHTHMHIQTIRGQGQHNRNKPHFCPQTHHVSLPSYRYGILHANISRVNSSNWVVLLSYITNKKICFYIQSIGFSLKLTELSCKVYNLSFCKPSVLPPNSSCFLLFTSLCMSNLFCQFLCLGTVLHPPPAVSHLHTWNQSTYQAPAAHTLYLNCSVPQCATYAFVILFLSTS